MTLPTTSSAQAARHGGAPDAGPRAADRLGWGLIVGWSVGTLGPVTLLYVVNYALLFFMTNLLGIPAAFAGVAIFGARLFDLAFDLLVGGLSDRTQSRWGRRRPWMFAGGIASAAACIILFNVPGGVVQAGGSAAPLAWVLAALLLYFAGYSMFNVPYLAMPAEMTESYSERTRLMSVRVFFIALSGLVGISAANWLVAAFGGKLAAYGEMSWVMGGISLVAMLASVLATSGARATFREKHHVPFARQVAIAAGNQPFMVLILAKLLILLTLSSVTTTLYYFVTLVLHRGPGALSVYGLCQTSGIVVSLPFWVRVGRTMSKQAVFALSIMIGVPVFLSFLTAGPDEALWVLLVRALVLGVSSGGALLMGQSLLPDTIDFDYRRSGMRREGVFSAIYSFVEKASFAAGPLVVGLLLGAFGYIAPKPGGAPILQTHQAMTGITMGVAVIPAVASTLAVVVLRFYRLTQADMRGMEVVPSNAGAESREALKPRRPTEAAVSDRAFAEREYAEKTGHPL